MRRKAIYLTVLMAVMTFTSFNLINAQEEESSSPIDLGVDVYSSYIWRGAKFGNGPAFQPWVEAAFGDLAIGAWGSVSSSNDEGFEMDLYAGYSFGPVSLTITDYYFGGDWMDFSENHFFEPMLGLELGGFSLTAAYMLTSGSDAEDAVAGVPATIDTATWTITPAIEAMEAVDEVKAGDIYLELGYSFENFDVAVGAGNNQYVAAEDDFTVCNVTIGSSKEVAITEKFSLPISGSVTLNPSTGGFFISVGVSF